MADWRMWIGFLQVTDSIHPPDIVIIWQSWMGLIIIPIILRGNTLSKIIHRVLFLQSFSLFLPLSLAVFLCRSHADIQTLWLWTQKMNPQFSVGVSCSGLCVCYNCDIIVASASATIPIPFCFSHFRSAILLCPLTWPFSAHTMEITDDEKENV